MKLRAPAGAGNPSVGGVTIKPDATGLYEVDEKIAAGLIESFGFVDANAPPKPAVSPPAATSPALRDAVLAGLKDLGVAVAASATDDVLAKALSAAIAGVNGQMLAAVKRAEDDVLAKLAAGDAAKPKPTPAPQPAKKA